MSEKQVSTNATNALEIVEFEKIRNLKEMSAICHMGDSFYCWERVNSVVKKSQDLLKWEELTYFDDISIFEYRNIANNISFEEQLNPSLYHPKNSFCYTKDFKTSYISKLPSKKNLEFITVLYFNGEYHFITNKIIFRTKDLVNFDQYSVEENYKGMITSAACNSNAILLTICKGQAQNDCSLLCSTDGRFYDTCSADFYIGEKSLYALSDMIYLGDTGTVRYTSNGLTWGETSLDFTIDTDKIVKQGDVTLFRATFPNRSRCDLYATRDGVDFVKIPVKQDLFDWIAYDGERLVLARDDFGKKASLYKLRFNAPTDQLSQEDKPKAAGLAAQDFVKLFDEGELTNKQIRELLVAFADTLRSGE